MQIGPYKLANQVIAAPMAGVSDKPYRQVCRQHGAGMVVSEMVTSRSDLRHTTKSRYRHDLCGEPEPVVVQMVGTEPELLAEAAQYNVANGAQIIDINMGCPAKKVCKKAAGSALLADEQLVDTILRSVVAAVEVPVTVKVRTGTDPQRRNIVTIAQIAEQAGIQAITIHGRTRACRFVGEVEYDSIRAAKDAVSIPVIANGDIDSPQKARQVLDYTKADAVMIGRAAQGKPWLFSQIAHYLQNQQPLPAPSLQERAHTIVSHVQAIHEFYGEHLGVRFARKHIKWYLSHWPMPCQTHYRQQLTTTENTHEQVDLLRQFLEFCLLQDAA